MTPDHSYICTGGIGGVYLLDYELSNSKAIWHYKTFDHIQSVKMSSDGEYIVAGSKEKSIYLFDKGFTANKYLWRYRTGGEMNSVSITSDGSTIAAGGTDTKIYVLDRLTSDLLWYYIADDKINNVKISDDGKYISAGVNDGKVYFFDIEYTGNKYLWEFGTKYNPDWIHVSFNPPGNRKQILRAIKKNGKTVYKKF